MSFLQQSIVRDAEEGIDFEDREAGRQAKRELILLWIFLAAVLVISLLSAWRFWAKVQNQ